jgi:hypothetical protein
VWAGGGSRRWHGTGPGGSSGRLPLEPGLEGTPKVLFSLDDGPGTLGVGIGLSARRGLIGHDNVLFLMRSVSRSTFDEVVREALS